VVAADSDKAEFQCKVSGMAVSLTELSTPQSSSNGVKGRMASMRLSRAETRCEDEAPANFTADVAWGSGQRLGFSKTEPHEVGRADPCGTVSQQASRSESF